MTADLEYDCSVKYEEKQVPAEKDEEMKPGIGISKECCNNIIAMVSEHLLVVSPQLGNVSSQYVPLFHQRGEGDISTR